MTDALPKIWNTTFTDHTINVRNINYHIKNNTLDRRVEGSRGFLYPDGKPLPADLVPEYIFLISGTSRRTTRRKRRTWS